MRVNRRHSGSKHDESDNRPFTAARFNRALTLVSLMAGITRGVEIATGHEHVVDVPLLSGLESNLGVS